MAGTAAVLLLAAVYAAPFVPGIHLVFAAVCHQTPARCFTWLGRPLPVCARCLGLYAGVLAAALWPVARKWGYPLAALAAANGADWLFDLTSNQVRFLLALPFFWLAASTLITLASQERAASH